MPSQILAFVLGAYLPLVIQALPQVSFPLVAQVPPAAVAGEIYAFTFSPQTFTSGEVLEYSLLEPPHWLSLDSSTRSLNGTPSAADVGDTKVSIQASDTEGHAFTDFELSVLATNSIRVKQDLVQESLSRAGSISIASTLSLHPQAEFKLVFGSSVFETEGNELYYFATSDGHTPLPAWLSFDPAAVAFSGKTPTLLTPQSSPQTFAFSLAAGQAPGVSQASFSFEISVTNHVLTFLNPIETFNITANEQFVIPSLKGSLRRDSTALLAGTIRRQSSDPPDWLAFNANDLSYKGTVPRSVNSTQFRLSVADDQNNIAATQISLISIDESAISSHETFLGAVNAIRNQSFLYTFNISSELSQSSTVDVNLGAAKAWLTWIAQNSSIVGTVPNDERAVTVNITLSITKEAQVEQTLYLPVKIINSSSINDPENASNTQNSPGVTPSPPTSDRPPGNSEASITHRNLALKIAFPLVAAAILLSVILLILRKIRRQCSHTTTTEASDVTSDSLQPQSSVQESSSGNILIEGRTSGTESLRSFLASSPPPRIEMNWSSRRQPLSRLFSQSSRDGRNTPTTRSSWSDMLNEVDSPIYYGHYNRIGDRGFGTSEDELPPPPTKVNYLTRQSTVTPVMRALDKQRSSASTTVNKFSGRRSSGLGHGTGHNESGSAANQSTLRQVPLSPLRESPLTEQNAMLAATRYRLPRNASSDKTLSTMHSKLGRLRSLASSSSRYDDPDMESSEGSCYHGADRAKVVLEEQDWQTMSNDSETSSGHQKSGSREEEQEVFQSRRVLPVSFSKGFHVPGDQSQTNSLRFI